MTKNLTLRLFRQVVFAGAVVVSTSSMLDAQSFGGGFESPAANQPSARTNQRAEFNSLPFRAANKQSVKPPIRLTTPANPSASAALRPLDGDANFGPASGAQTGSAKSNRVVAMPASYGTKVSDSKPQFGTQESQSVTVMPDYIDIPVCMVHFIDDIMLPAKESGVILSLSVKEGDYVPAGTVVGKIDDELYQRMLEQAKLRYDMAAEAANDQIAIEAADAKYKVAAIEAKKTSDLADKGSKSGSDRLMAMYTKDIASLERDKAVRDKENAELEKRLEAARFMEVQTHIKGHILQSDFDAYVIKVIKKPQEYVRQGEEVMRIARMDSLWVVGTILTTNVNPEEVFGRPVTVTVERARGEVTTFEGKITSVGLETQGGIRCQVKAEVQNRPAGEQWVLQPMSNVRMRIHLKGQGVPDGSFGSTVKSN